MRIEWITPGCVVVAILIALLPRFGISISFDLLLTGGSIILTLFMLPMIYNRGTKVPFWSSFPTAIVLFPYFGILFYLLGTPIMAVTVSIEGLLWWLIVFRRRLRKESTPTEGEKFVNTVKVLTGNAKIENNKIVDTVKVLNCGKCNKWCSACRSNHAQGIHCEHGPNSCYQD